MDLAYLGKCIRSAFRYDRGILYRGEVILYVGTHDHNLFSAEQHNHPPLIVHRTQGNRLVGAGKRER